MNKITFSQLSTPSLQLVKALGLGLGLTLALLWLLEAGAMPPVRAQQGTGIIRVAPGGVDAPGCGSETDPCVTVQFAVDQSNPGDEIHLAAGTFDDLETRSGLTQVVYISKPLTLRGGYTTADWAISDPEANPTTLDALGRGRGILVTETARVTVENLTVTGGTIDGNHLCPTSCGGGILATGPLSLTHVQVISNAAGRDGGGVTGMMTTTLAGVRFAHNFAEFDGGGLATYGPLALSDTTFVQNTSVLGGGAARFNGPASVVSSRFERNTSLVNVGGGLATSAAPSVSQTLYLSDTLFISNVNGCNSAFPICHGGGIYAFDINITAANSRFENNRCADADCDGGGLYLGRAFNAGTLVLTNTDFISNTAGRNGGGAHAAGLVLLDGGRFVRNHVDGGGSVFSDGGGGLSADGLILTGTQFISNTSGEDGGGVLVNAYLFASTARLTDAYFESNVAANNGGGLAFDGFSSNPTSYVQASQFFSNVAGMNGGGLWLANSSSLNLIGSRFEHNRADAPPNDGALARTENGGGGAWVGGTLALTDTEFVSNTAQTNGGGAHVRGDAVLSGGRFDRNRSWGTFGGFLYGGGGLYTFGSLTFASTLFTANRATFLGGGGLNLGPVTGVDGKFQGNYSDGYGGGLYTAGPLAVTGTQFISNASDGNGGGVLADAAVTVTAALFQNNRSDGDFGSGGGLWAGDKLAVGNTQFISNSAKFAGGGVHAGDVVTLSNSLFRGNRSDGSGGGLLAFFDPVMVMDTRFISNTTRLNGGGMQSAGTAYLVNSLFRNNRNTQGNGGGLALSGRLIMTGSQIISNSAALEGGGAWANSGAVLDQAHFENNRSGGSGGGLAAPLGRLDLAGGQFVGNTAALDGGGAYSFEATTVGGSFESNVAQRDGGGLFLRRRLTLTGTRFIDNRAASFGGGVVITNAFRGKGRLVNGLFARNVAGAGGSGLYLGNRGSFSILHATIASPTIGSGQAIHVATGTVSITNAIVTGYATDIAVTAGATVSEDYNLFADGPDLGGVLFSGGHSLTGDPAFFNPSGDDYRLTTGSGVAIDAGTEAGVPLDFEGDARPYGTGRPDIGYDESSFVLFDLSIDKIASPATNVRYRGQISYTVTLTNAGVRDASGTLLTDTLPGPVLFARWVQAPAGASLSEETITWSGTVPALGNVTFTFVVSHAGNYGDVFTNTARFFHPESDSSGVNQAPVRITGQPLARDDEAGTFEDTPVSIDALDNDSDPDGDDLTLLAVTTPANGAVAIIGVGVRYTPTLNFAGVDTFDYTLTDGAGGLDEATITVTVAPVNDPPVATEDVASTDEDQPVTIDLLDNDSDPEGDDLTLLAVTTPANGAVAIVGAGVRYTPTLNFAGVDTFDYTLTDGAGGLDEATITVTVAPVNDPPVATKDVAYTDEDQPVTIDLLGNDSDPDGDDLTLLAVTTPANGAVAIVGAGVRYTPTLNFYGTERLDYVISDGILVATATTTVTVNPVNDPPFISDIPDQSTRAGVPAGPILFVIGDVETPAEELVLAASSSDSVLVPNGHISLAGHGADRTLIITPVAGLVGIAVITVTVEDGADVTSDPLTLTVIADEASITRLYLPLLFKRCPPQFCK